MRMLLLSADKELIEDTALKYFNRYNEVTHVWNENAGRLIPVEEFKFRKLMLSYVVADPTDQEVEQMRKNFAVVKFRQTDGIWYTVAEHTPGVETVQRLYMLDAVMEE